MTKTIEIDGFVFNRPTNKQLNKLFYAQRDSLEKLNDESFIFDFIDTILHTLGVELLSDTSQRDSFIDTVDYGDDPTFGQRVFEQLLGEKLKNLTTIVEAKKS